MTFWVTCKIAQPIQPNWQHIFVLPWSALKKPPWAFNFSHSFGIPSSRRHEKRCQILQILFWLFQCSKNPRCDAFGSRRNKKYPLLGPGEYGNTSCGVFKQGVQKYFYIRVNIPKGNYWILSFELMASCQK